MAYPWTMEGDRQLVEFVRANRRRNAIVFLVLGVLLVAAGAVVIAIMIALPPAPVVHHGRYEDYRWLIVPGSALVVVGLGSLVAAYRFYRGQLTSLDATSDLSAVLIGTNPPEALPDVAPLPEAIVVERD